MRDVAYMKLPFTKKMVTRWGGQRKFVEGTNLYENCSVINVNHNHPLCSGEILRGERSIKTKFKLCKDGAVEPLCPCYESTQRGLVCVHIIALALALIERYSDPDRARKALEEERRAKRMQNIDESMYIQRVTDFDPEAVPAKLILELGTDFEDTILAGHVDVQVFLKSSEGNAAISQVPKGRLHLVSAQDEATLFVLEDVCEGPVGDRVSLSLPDFVNILSLYKGLAFAVEQRAVQIQIMQETASSILRVDLDHENGELILSMNVVLPGTRPVEQPVYCITNRSGWVYADGGFWNIDKVLPPPMHHLYSQMVRVPRSGVPNFMQNELPALQDHIRIESEVPSELFILEPAEPEFILRIKGSPASLSAQLLARYEDVVLTANREDPAGAFALPDLDDLLRYGVRNTPAEASALDKLSQLGFRGMNGDRLSSIVGLREVLNFLGRDLPILKRQGWKIEMEGAIAGHMEEATFAVPVVRIDEKSGSDWFEVSYGFEDAAGGSISQADVYRALQKGDSFIRKHDRVTLLDAAAIRDMGAVFRDCSFDSGDAVGSFKVSGVYSSYIKSSLDALDGVDVEASKDWLSSAELKRGKTATAKVDLDPEIERILRPYQKEGINWMRSLEQSGFCGVLADEMGLGKTLQTLVWISAARLLPESRNKPALVICPTSLVENWQAEAAKFTPHLRTLVLTGADRSDRRDQLGSVDLGISSYAIMRRDIDFYEQHDFSVLVLDEAQHIKNHSTQNARAAKRLRSDNRLVLTGTPIENSVADIWSIMDFLMPGYLGSHRKFRDNYERPIASMTSEGERAQQRLRRKLEPFLLRRTKREVAKDLPDKIERVAYCALTPDQKRVYSELAKSYRRKLDAIVQREGVGKSRMEVLKVLLQLRQASCHLDLLKGFDLNSQYPSGKLDMFFELLDEAMDGGHRVLVFSQFVSMLSILRSELDERGLRYCYLDGSTKDRLAVVKRFNTTPDIPLFLISLKAGGVGLNLTGADMVVHFDPWWNPAVEAQATDRAHRIGQRRTVYSVKLIAKGTVEEKVLDMQERKRKIIDATITSGGDVLSGLSWDEIKSLLSY